MQLKGAEIRNFYDLMKPIPLPGGSDVATNTALIPIYQRPYRWESEQISQLIQDYHRHGTSDYFSGAVVTVDDTHGPHKVIDGQQRFTTLFLTNYLVFLLARACLHLAITAGKDRHLDFFYDMLSMSMLHLIESPPSKHKSTEIADELDKFKDKLDRASNEQGKKREEQIDEIERTLNKLTGMSALTLDHNNYMTDAATSIKTLFASNKPRLQYSREIFNSRLLEALASSTVTISNKTLPKLSFAEKSIEEAAEISIYVNAMECIFESIAESIDSSDPLQRGRDLLTASTKFLTNVRMCLVQTGDAHDAFTLFEVLNDRSVALDDLDLMKNEIYKAFVEQNTSVLDNEIDKALEAADKTWTEDVFDKQGVKSSKLIAYFAISFLSGSKTATHTQEPTIRKALAEFLDSYRKTKKSFDGQALECTIRAFECSKRFIKTLSLSFRDMAKKALEDANSQGASQTEKTASYLMAAKQESVLVGLFCFSLKHSIDKGNFALDPEKYHTDLKNEMAIPTSELNNVAKELWRKSILSRDSKGPRPEAAMLVQDNSLNAHSCRNSVKAATSQDYDEFGDFLDAWQYPKNDLKIKYLFTKLIRLTVDPETKRLVQPKAFRTTLDPNRVANIQLDHMEPSKIDQAHAVSYFDNPDRVSIVNSLGNIMILLEQNNASKSNKPFNSVFTELDKCGLSGHFLVQDIRELYASFNNKDIPTEQFFSSRRARLKVQFIEAIKL